MEKVSVSVVKAHPELCREWFHLKDIRTMIDFELQGVGQSRIDFTKASTVGFVAKS